MVKLRYMNVGSNESGDVISFFDGRVMLYHNNDNTKLQTAHNNFKFSILFYLVI